MTEHKSLEDGDAANKPAEDLRVERLPRRNKPLTYLTLAEQHAIEDFVFLPQIDHAYMLFAMGTGLRQGEQENLELADVHMNVDRPYVLVRYGSQGRAPLKSGKPRAVPVFGVARRALLRSLDLLVRDRPENPLGLVFPLSGSEHRGAKALSLRDICSVGGVERDVRWQDLRKTCAKSLVAGWWGRTWSLDEVRDVLG